MVKNSDLHTHSYYSDGTLSPKELVRLAKKRGIKNLALTDHNSVKGVNEAIKEGKRIGVKVIPAVEIRCDCSEILAYFIDYKNKELKNILNQSNKKLQIRIKDWCKKINKVGYPVTYKEIQKKFPEAKGNYNELHPVHLLYLKGYGKPFELFKKFSENKKTQRKKIKEDSIIKVIKLVKKAGGVPVLAHPWVDKNSFKRIKELVKAGLKGIEFNNGDDIKFMRNISGRKNIVNDIKTLAKKYNLILTYGSDYHGPEMVKLMPGKHNLGKNNCDGKVVDKLR